MRFERRGFTLIEMLIVIAIIGILASVVLVGLGPIQRQGRDARRQSDLRNVQNALELYFSKNGEYPDTNDWGDLETALNEAEIGIKQIPNDPSDRDYFYGTDGSSYVLGAQLEDSGNRALDNDVDDLVHGVDCGAENSDTIYCIEF